MEQKFPSPDKIEIRHDDRMIVMITSRRFRRMSTMKRQDYVHDILMAELTHEERRQVLLVVCVTPEEELVYSSGLDE